MLVRRWSSRQLLQVRECLTDVAAEELSPIASTTPAASFV